MKKTFGLDNMSAVLANEGVEHIYVKASEDNAKLVAAYNKLRRLCTDPTAGAQVKKLCRSAVAANSWYRDGIDNLNLTYAEFERSFSAYADKISDFIRCLGEYETKAKAVGVGEEIIHAAHAFLDETKAAFTAFRKSLKREATAAADFIIKPSMQIKGDSCRIITYEGEKRIPHFAHGVAFRRDLKKFSMANLIKFYADAVTYTVTPHEYLHKGLDTVQLSDTHTALVISHSTGADTAYDALLVNAHGKPVYTKDDVTPVMTLKLTKMEAEATAAAEFSIKASEKLEGDYAGIRMYEGSQLRTNFSLSTFSNVKLVNIYKKAIEKTLRPDPHLFQGINMIQRPGCHTTLTVHVRGAKPRDSEPVNIMSLRDAGKRYEILLVNAHNKPVYSKDDITPLMTLKITAMTEKTATAATKSKLQLRVEEWASKELDDKQIKELVALIKADSRLGVIAKKFPKLHHGIEYATVSKGDKELEFAYLNSGDTYNTTLLRNPLNDKLEITTLGDMIEYLGSKGWQAE